MEIRGCIHPVMLIELLWVLKKSIEHAINLLQQYVVIVLDSFFAKILMSYFPAIEPTFSVSH